MPSSRAADKTSPAAPAKTPPAKNAAKSEAEAPKDYLESVKENLSYAIAGKRATIKMHGQVIEFQRWGLQKRLSLGTRVMNLVSRLQTVIPALDSGDGLSLENLQLLLQALSYATDDVIDIVARSIVSPWPTTTATMQWIDDHCELEDLFDLAVIVYEMNLKGELLGKLQSSLEGVQTRMNSLLKESSKS